MKYQKVLIAVCFVWFSTIFSEIPITIDEKMWVPDFDVRVIASTADKIYIGGGFKYVGPATGGGAVVDTVNGQLKPGFPIISHSCSAAESDGKGGWYIIGDLLRTENVARKYIAHILPDNTVDTSWNPQMNNSVYTLSLCGSKIYVGGSFTSINGKKRNRIACLDAATGAVIDWDPNASLSTYPTQCGVSTIKIYGSNVYVGGLFDSIGGQKRQNLACLDTINGLATDWNPSADKQVYTFTFNEHYLYAGGLFTAIGGKTRGHLARIELNTGVVSDWNPNANYYRYPSDCRVNSIVAVGRNIYVGGKFDTIGGKVRRFIACLDSGTGEATDWNPDANKPVYALHLNGAKLYTGGDFDSIGGFERNFIACLDITTGIPTDWNPSGSRTVYAISQFGNTVFLAGNGTSMNTVKRRFAACIDKKTKKATAWNPDLDGIVSALVVSGAKVYISGYFDTIGGKNRNHVACVDTISGKVTDWDPKISSFYSSVDAIVPHCGKVYLGGSFDSAGGQPRRSLTACDTITGAVSDWNPNPIPNNSSITTLSIVGEKVYVGGHFTNIGGANRNWIACLDTFTGAALPWNPNITGNGSLRTISIYGSKVYAGGLYTNVGDIKREGIARIDIGTGLADDWNPLLTKNSSVDYIIPFQSRVFYCGSFYSVGDCTGDRIGYFDAITGDVVDWDICMEGGSINTFAIDTNDTDLTDLYVGGSYYTIDGKPHFNFTHFYSDKTTTHLRKPITKIEHSSVPTIKISNQQCRIHYTLLSASRVHITLGNLQGKIISTATNTIQPAGVYSSSIETASLAPGLYLLYTRIGEINKTQSFTIVK